MNKNLLFFECMFNYLNLLITLNQFHFYKIQFMENTIYINISKLSPRNKLIQY